jgi:hypothetical protein
VLLTVSDWAAEYICDNEIHFYRIREYVISKRLFWTAGPVTMKALRSFETSGTDHQTLQRHIPKDLNFMQHCQESIKSHTGGSTT